MADLLDTLAHDAQATVRDGYYATAVGQHPPPRRLTDAIQACSHAAIIAEIKWASPSRGRIRDDGGVEGIAWQLQQGGAVAISVLTEPKHFHGSLRAFRRVRAEVDLPLLMKDILLTYVQVDAAAAIGADAILLIAALFARGYGEGDVEDLIDYAHAQGLQVLLEAHTASEFAAALATEADAVGINNRDLRTFTVDLNTTPRLLQRASPAGKVVVSESGIQTAADIRFLHASGAHAFLVGSAIMDVDDMESKVRELVMAL